MVESVLRGGLNLRVVHRCVERMDFLSAIHPSSALADLLPAYRAYLLSMEWKSAMSFRLRD
jgi:hypothetical protein